MTLDYNNRLLNQKKRNNCNCDRLSDLFTQAYVLRKPNLKVIHKIMHATKKTQVFIRPVLKEERLKLYAILFTCS